MALENVNRFIGPVPNGGRSSWSFDDLHTLASQRLPDVITDRNDLILRADVNALWLKWFIEGFCSPLRYVDDTTKGEAHVLLDVTKRVNEMLVHEPAARRQIFAKRIAERVMEEVNRQRDIKRDFANKQIKEDLIAAAATPRCWMCGYAFSAEALGIFLKKPGVGALQLPKLVDLLRPRGIIDRDISIEVEHIVPVASGGAGAANLALACGWCNRYKGAKTSIYDATFRAPRSPYKLGGSLMYELPHPFWTIRLLAVRRKCEHLEGCDAHADTHEMFIAPVSSLGSPNPSNLQVFCGEHDPHRLHRFVTREDAEKVWEERRR
jgi:hypothetical protein